MAEYIEKEAVEKFIENGLNNQNKDKAFGHDAVEIMAEVHYMPAADVAPVRRGKWVKIYENGEPAIEQHQVGVFCNKCMKMPKDKFTESDFCPNCGAIMDLEEEPEFDV